MSEVTVPIKRSIYKKELHRTFLALEVEGTYREDYQMKMLSHNKVQGVLHLHARGVDNVSIYEYDVSGKKALTSVYKDKKINTKDIKEFLTQLCGVLEIVAVHLLEERCLLLSPEHIFYEKGIFYFCYFPPGGGSIQEAFHTLTEFFVKQTDYQDTESVKIVFTLHKETMEENYSLKKIVEQLEEEKEEEQAEETIEPQNMFIEQTLPEEMTEQNQNVLKEEHNFWLPVKEFLNKHKKPKWGDWEDLYLEEKKL